MVFNTAMTTNNRIKFRDNFPSNLIQSQKKNIIEKFNTVIDNIAAFYQFLNFKDRILPRSFETRSAITIQEYLAFTKLMNKKLDDNEIIYSYSFYNNFEQFHWNHEICFRILMNIDYDAKSNKCKILKYYRYFDAKQSSIETYDIIYCGKFDSEDDYAYLITKIAEVFTNSLFDDNMYNSNINIGEKFEGYNLIETYLGIIYWWDIFTSLLHAGLLNNYPDNMLDLSRKYYNIDDYCFYTNRNLVEIISKIIERNSKMDYEEETINLEFIEENYDKLFSFRSGLLC